MKNTKILRMVILFLVCCALIVPTFNVSADASDLYNYDEDEFVVPISQRIVVPQGYIGIYSASDLDNIRYSPGSNYILMNDIDLSVCGNWEPIGNSMSFSGHFNGNGYSITGLQIESIGSSLSSELNLGLFASNSGIIENLRLVNPQVSVRYTDYSLNNIADENFSALIANNTGTCNNCVVSGCSINVTATWPYNYHPTNFCIGGICGESYGTINNCTSSGTISVNGVVVCVE